ncbi:PPC domain-containing DNA-binding protein, partial [Candidatus Latescibacterota bacterium]
VTGPVRDTIPPEPDWVSLEGIWEVVGIGTLFEADGKPSLHLHGSYGRKRQSLTGCLRKIAEVFLVVEVIILELVGTDARRLYDPSSGLFLLHPSPEK